MLQVVTQSLADGSSSKLVNEAMESKDDEQHMHQESIHFSYQNGCNIWYNI
jgi:hypothetical protein